MIRMVFKHCHCHNCNKAMAKPEVKVSILRHCSQGSYRQHEILCLNCYRHPGPAVLGRSLNISGTAPRK